MIWGGGGFGVVFVCLLLLLLLLLLFISKNWAGAGTRCEPPNYDPGNCDQFLFDIHYNAFITMLI